MEPSEYVRSLEVARPEVMGDYVQRTRGTGSGLSRPEAVVDLGAVLGFVGGLDEQQRSDVLDSVQLAQRAADARFDRFADTQKWYEIYTEVLQRVGWVLQQTARIEHRQAEGNLSVSTEAINLLAQVATENALGVLSSAFESMKRLADQHGAIEFLKYNSLAGSTGNVQIGVAERDAIGTVSLAMGGFHFRTLASGGSFLSTLFGSKKVELWGSAQKMTLNTAIFDKIRNEVVQKLGCPADFIASLGPLGSTVLPVPSDSRIIER